MPTMGGEVGSGSRCTLGKRWSRGRNGCTTSHRSPVTWTNSWAGFYRDIDCTERAAPTIDFIREAVETELPSELRYLTVYDEVRGRMREIVEMPDRHADLFFKLVRQNHGNPVEGQAEVAGVRVAARKRNPPA